MLQTERLNELFTLLKEMTQLKNPKLPPTPIREGLLKHSTTGLLLTFFALLGLALWHHLGATPPGFRYALYIVQWLLIIFFFIPLATVIFSVPYFIRHRKQLLPGIWTSLENALQRDSELTKRLWKFDKAMLAFGLLHYRHRWSSLEGRLAIGGNWGKLALTTLSAALSIYATKLLKEDSTPFLFWGLVAIVVIVIVNSLALHTFLSRERPRLVIQLLEYAIQHADKCKTTPSI